MRTLLIASAALLLSAAAARAQNLQDIQAPVPLGGTDARALPERTRLPPMFGANLFSPVETSVQAGGAAQSGGGASPANPAAASATPGAAGGGTAAGGAADQATAIAAAIARAAGAQGSAIPSTSVQPQPGAAAYDPNHVMAPGDSVQIHIYGATTLDQQATVDSNGDIFLPTIGPIHVAGTLAGALQSAVAAGIESVYQRNAKVYVTLASAAPVNVFVTGAVIAPGQYAQPSTSSVIKFLQASGGIDPRRGSYRNIQVLRDGREIANVDLYAFLLHGELPSLRLR